MEQRHAMDLKQADETLHYLSAQIKDLAASQTPPTPFVQPPAAPPPNSGTHVSQELLAQFLQQAKECIHTGLAASASAEPNTNTSDLWK
eukprot:10512423-Karenia_brevis.AAC.1